MLSHQKLIKLQKAKFVHMILFDKEKGSVQFSRSAMSISLWPHELQHDRPPCPSPTPRVYEKEMATHSSVLAWRIPWMKKPGRLQSMGLHRVGHNWSDLAAAAAACPLSRWCHPSISSSVIPFSSCPQSFPASGSFQMSQLFTSGGQSISVSALTSVLPMNTQDWSPSTPLVILGSSRTVKAAAFVDAQAFSLYLDSFNEATNYLRYSLRISND